MVWTYSLDHRAVWVVRVFLEAFRSTVKPMDQRNCAGLKNPLF
jgi:hypothetical protein